MGKKNKVDIGTAFGVAAVVSNGDPNIFMAIFACFMQASQPEASHLGANGRRQNDQHAAKAQLLTRNRDR